MDALATRAPVAAHVQVMAGGSARRRFTGRTDAAALPTYTDKIVRGTGATSDGVCKAVAAFIRMTGTGKIPEDIRHSFPLHVEAAQGCSAN